MMMMDVGALLREARRDAGLSQRELARRAETSQATLARYERGHTVPTLATLERVLACAGKRLHLLVEEPLTAGSGPVGHRLQAQRGDVRRILQDHGVTRAMVFGSVARGQDTAESDLDLLVELPRPTYVALAALRADLEDALGIPVDVTVSALLTSSARQRAQAESVPL